MSTKHANPYREGLYHDLFGFIKQNQVVTRADLVTFTVEKLEKVIAAANAAVTVVLSPRKESKRGDCRGNMSAAGHLYFMEKLPRQVKGGVKEPQKFRLRYRTPALEPRKRTVSVAVKAEKVVATTPAPVVEKA